MSCGQTGAFAGSVPGIGSTLIETGRAADDPPAVLTLDDGGVVTEPVVVPSDDVVNG
jgi:hypothetical protein